MNIVINTVGSCLGNPGTGGYGMVFCIEGTKEIMVSGKYGGENTTNNIMELTAAIEALKVIHDLGLVNANIKIVTDSKYVINGITDWINAWRMRSFKGVKNKELWLELDDIHSQFSNITWEWVKGHNKNYFNELADSAANNAASTKKDSLNTIQQ